MSIGAEKFNGNTSKLKLLGGFTNNVFECEGKDGPFILKFYSDMEHSCNSVKSELDWISYLSNSGVNLTTALPSVNGNLIENATENGRNFSVLAFRKAKGTFVDEADANRWNPGLFYKWGKVMGSIHSLSKSYKPIDDSIKRQEWNEGPLFLEFPEVEDTILRKWNQYINKIKKLPKDINAYGMIHNDLHQKNFLLNDNEVVLFDFGDCEYNWFIYDIAISLYHALQSISDSDRQQRKEFAVLFLKSYLRGYHTENKLNIYWLSKILFFLNYRQLFSYLYFTVFLSTKQKNSLKIAQILNNMRRKIENDIPYLEIDLEELSLEQG